MRPEWILMAVGICLLIFRSHVARWQREFQNRVYGFGFGEDKQGPIEFLVILVGIGFVVIAAVLLQQTPTDAESSSRVPPGDTSHGSVVHPSVGSSRDSATAVRIAQELYASATAGEQTRASLVEREGAGFRATRLPQNPNQAGGRASILVDSTGASRIPLRYQ